jgi:hypothetical protein
VKRIEAGEEIEAYVRLCIGARDEERWMCRAIALVAGDKRMGNRERSGKRLIRPKSETEGRRGTSMGDRM